METALLSIGIPFIYVIGYLSTAQMFYRRYPWGGMKSKYESMTSEPEKFAWTFLWSLGWPLLLLGFGASYYIRGKTPIEHVVSWRTSRLRQIEAQAKEAESRKIQLEKDIKVLEKEAGII